MLDVTVILVSPGNMEFSNRCRSDTFTVRTIPVDLHVLAELTGLAIDLDAVVQELLEARTVEDTIARRARVVDDELVLSSSRLSGGGLGLTEREERENPD